MQTVLCLDASRSPAVGVVAQITGNTVEVVERQEIVFDPSAPFESILSGQSPVPTALETSDKPADFHSPITNALVILPPIDYISTVLSLPFQDQRQLSRVIESELQDIVPFDTADFVLHHRVVGRRADGTFSIHVAAIPRTIVKNAIAVCHSRGIDPVVLTTPESVLQAVASLRSEAAESVLYCYVSDRFAHLALCENGSITLDRAIDRSAPYTNGAHGGSVSLQALLYRVRLEVGSLERRSGKHISKVVFVDSVIDTGPVSEAIGRPVEIVHVGELLKDAASSDALAVLGTLLADDNRAPTVLTNFRVKEFSFRPPLKELLGALKILAPYCIVAIALALFYLLAVYILTEAQLRSLESEAAQQISANAPGIAASGGNEAKALAAETIKIEDELKDLGSPESYSPLETLAVVSGALPSIPDVTVDRIDVKGTKVTLEGCAPNYGAVETIETTLGHSELFSEVKKLPLATCSGGRTTGRGFKFELWMKE
jgi:hypothetical protein